MLYSVHCLNIDIGYIIGFTHRYIQIVLCFNIYTQLYIYIYIALVYDIWELFIYIYDGLPTHHKYTITCVRVYVYLYICLNVYIYIVLTILIYEVCIHSIIQNHVFGLHLSLHVCTYWPGWYSQGPLFGKHSRDSQ